MKIARLPFAPRCVLLLSRSQLSHRKPENNLTSPKASWPKAMSLFLTPLDPSFFSVAGSSRLTQCRSDSIGEILEITHCPVIHRLYQPCVALFCSITRRFAKATTVGQARGVSQPGRKGSKWFQGTSVLRGCSRY